MLASNRARYGTAIVTAALVRRCDSNAGFDPSGSMYRGVHCCEFGHTVCACRFAVVNSATAVTRKDTLGHSRPGADSRWRIDHFKRVNGTYGHQAGDMVLKELTLVVVSEHTLRADDVFARFGGEEFAVISRGTDLSGAHRFGGCASRSSKRTWGLTPRIFPSRSAPRVLRWRAVRSR